MNLDEIATVDRRAAAERRNKSDRRRTEKKVDVERRAVATDRRQKVERRRQIDPTTCERDYTAAEIEFMTAMDKYRRQSGRPFPTWSEVLEVVISLGYQKVEQPAVDAVPVITGV
jgi:hypothetical protein